MNQRLNFLKNISPFNLLSEEVLLEVVDLLHEVRYSKDTLIYEQETSKMKGVDIIAVGEYESFFYDKAHNKRLVEYHHQGFCYGGVSVLLNRKRSLRTVIAKKGTIIYFLPRRDFRGLCQANEEFFHYFTSEFGKRMLNEDFAHFVKRPNTNDENFTASDQLYSRKLETIETREIVSCNPETPIYLAAKIMADNKVGCLFVNDKQKNIVGFVTDMIMRDNVIAVQGDTHSTVETIMDTKIVSIDPQAYVYEGILLMFQTKSRYLLIGENGHFRGFISRNKLLSENTQSPLVFIQSVKSALSLDELKKKWETVPEIVTQLLNRGVRADIVNQVITTVADTIAVKIIEGVIDELGTPPAKFVFMVLGSEGRKEQTLKTDQDNAIIYEDKANEQRELVREYFLNFAEIVSERLDHVGLSYCTGGFMARNPKWTHSLSHWKRNYISWMEESVPETVIKFSTFFDCRYLYGEASIIEELKVFLNEELQKPMEKLFFFMAKNALQYEPPLTFFKNIRTIKIGSQQVFDIKKTMTPIVDLVRVYALKNRIFKTNTGERIKALKEKGVFSESAFLELSQAYYHLMSMRLKKQASQMILDKTEPDNYIDLGSLTKIEQVTLKEIFRTIENFQSRIRLEYTNTLF